MRISVRYGKEKPLPRTILLVATNWFKKVGVARINLVNNTYSTYVESKVEGKGVAKALLLRVEIVLQKLAKSTKKKFYHKVYFQTPEAKIRLERYLERFGSKLGYKKKGDIWYKEYKL